ncbi:MAG: hypothetical protein EBR82_87665 [Caulobacteraceae bacterium]|nr:hypothetical protein [Caulobacteraceae bacterium]
MGRTKVEDRMLLRSDEADDELKIYGSTTGTHGTGDPCVIAATDSMSEAQTFVYLPLEDAVADIMDDMDLLPIEEMAALIRAAVERGIERGSDARRKDGRE